MIENLTTATPVEIDTVLADLYGKAYVARQGAERQYQEMQQWIGREINEGGYRARPATNDEVTDYLLDTEGSTEYKPRQIHQMWKRYEDLYEQFESHTSAQQPYSEEFVRRGGWTRAFLVVTSGKGHVHRSMDCHTTYATTQFHWVIDLSGKTEEEVVEAAGERACTVCYPTAPVEVLSRPTSIFSEDEKEAQRRREERAAAKAAREAAQIVVANWQDGSCFTQKVFKTERALTNALAERLSSLTWYGEGHPSADEWLWNIEQGKKALPSWDYNKALETARKKVSRQGGTAKY